MFGLGERHPDKSHSLLREGRENVVFASLWKWSNSKLSNDESRLKLGNDASSSQPRCRVPLGAASTAPRPNTTLRNSWISRSPALRSPIPRKWSFSLRTDSYYLLFTDASYTFFIVHSNTDFMLPKTCYYLLVILNLKAIFSWLCSLLVCEN